MIIAPEMLNEIDDGWFRFAQTTKKLTAKTTL